MPTTETPSLRTLTPAQKVNINGVYVAPQELTFGIQAVDLDAGRAVDGTMHRNMVATKRSYNVKLPPCHSDVVRPLMLAMAGQQFRCTFPDPMAANYTYTGTFYVGDRTGGIYNYDLDIWTDVQFSLIEI